MESFLQRNPGLRSRIAFHIPFKNYSVPELCDIAKLMVDKNGMRISDDAVDKLETIFGVAKEQKEFGNGRYVRNIIEQARMPHGSRLVKKGSDSLSDSEILTLTAEDILKPAEQSVRKDKKIGFQG